jgi:chemotaxis protein methyltransferase CheR
VVINHLEELGLPRTGVPLLRDLIHERTGLYYSDARCDTLCERLAPLVVDRGFRSYLDLYYLLKYEATVADWTRVMDALAVPETYFWREIDQIRAVVHHAVPALSRQYPTTPLRIWSAPCASGEEPLTIAMMLEEAGWFDRHPIEIHGSDGSGVAIERACAAVYRERSFRSLPPEMREKYFAPAGAGEWQPVPSLRARVRGYSVVNLMETAAVMPYACSPIVFCRNAFIYFSADAVKRVVANLAALMPHSGVLCLGASESLLNLATAFRLEELDGAFVYVKA